MNSLSIDITYHGESAAEIGDFSEAIPDVLKCAADNAGLAHDSGAELSIVFSDDDFLQELNSKWRRLDKPTNVLAFPVESLAPGQAAGNHLGDIIISLETARREADLENKGFNDHLTHLLVHGFLHLFGYDHQNDDQAETMESLECVILAKLNISDPYQHD